MAETVVERLGKSFRPSAVYLVPALPKTRNGKILRRVARAAFLDLDPGDVSALEDPVDPGADPGAARIASGLDAVADGCPRHLAAAVLCGALAIEPRALAGRGDRADGGNPDPRRGQVGTTLPVEYMQSTTFDLDGDGTRELVTVGTATDAPGLAALQAWWVDAERPRDGSNEIHRPPGARAWTSS